MAWGIFKKIKSGLQKAGKYIKSGLQKVAPIAKKALNFGTKAMPFIAGAANAIVPGSGTALSTGWNAVNGTMKTTGIDKFLDEYG
jgi:hypothetical protein